MSSHSEILKLPCFANAEELGERVGLDGNAVRKWRMRGSIPAAHWQTIVEIAQRSGHPEVTLQALTEAKRASLKPRRPTLRPRRRRQSERHGHAAA